MDLYDPFARRSPALRFFCKLTRMPSQPVWAPRYRTGEGRNRQCPARSTAGCFRPFARFWSPASLSPAGAAPARLAAQSGRLTLATPACRPTGAAHRRDSSPDGGRFADYRPAYNGTLFASGPARGDQPRQPDHGHRPAQESAIHPGVFDLHRRLRPPRCRPPCPVFNDPLMDPFSSRPRSCRRQAPVGDGSAGATQLRLPRRLDADAGRSRWDNLRMPAPKPGSSSAPPRRRADATAVPRSIPRSRPGPSTAVTTCRRRSSTRSMNSPDCSPRIWRPQLHRLLQRSGTARPGAAAIRPARRRRGRRPRWAQLDDEAGPPTSCAPRGWSLRPRPRSLPQPCPGRLRRPEFAAAWPDAARINALAD